MAFHSSADQRFDAAGHRLYAVNNGLAGQASFEDVPKSSGFLSGVVHGVAHVVHAVFKVAQLLFCVVEVRGGIVQSLLPPLDLVAVFCVIGPGVVQGLLDFGDPLFLDLQLPGQHIGLGRQFLLAVVVHVKSGCHRFHFSAKGFELLAHGF